MTPAGYIRREHERHALTSSHVMTMEQGISNETRQKKQGPEGEPVPWRGQLSEEHLAWGALAEGGLCGVRAP